MGMAADRAVKREVVVVLTGAAGRADDVVSIALAAELVLVDRAGVRVTLEGFPDAR